MYSTTPMTTAGLSDTVSLANIIEVTTAAHKQVCNCSREIIRGIIFSSDVIASSSVVQKHLVKEVIIKTMLSVISLCGKFSDNYYN